MHTAFSVLVITTPILSIVLMHRWMKQERARNALRTPIRSIHPEHCFYPLSPEQEQQRILGQIYDRVHDAALLGQSIARCLGETGEQESILIASLRRNHQCLSAKAILATMHSAMERASHDRLMIRLNRQNAGEKDDPCGPGVSAIAYGIAHRHYDDTDLLLIGLRYSTDPETFAEQHWNTGWLIEAMNSLLNPGIHSALSNYAKENDGTNGATRAVA